MDVLHFVLFCFFFPLPVIIERNKDLDEWLIVFKNAISYQLDAHKKMAGGNTANYEQTISNLSGNMSNLCQLPPLNQVQMVCPENRLCADCNSTGNHYNVVGCGGLPSIAHLFYVRPGLGGY